MTNKEIQNIYFQNNEVNALYMGVDLIWKKENGGGEWTGKYMVEGYTVEPNTTVNSSYYNFTSDENGYFGFDLEKIPTNLTTYFYNKNQIKALKFNKNFNTENVNLFSWLFKACTNLVSLDISNFKTEKVQDMNNMFSGCSNLTKLDLSNFNTSNCTTLNYMFSGCSNLTTLYVNFDVSKKNNDKFGYMFYYCDNLTNVIGTFEGLYTGLDLHYSPLTAQSAMVFINGLAEVEETKTLRLSATTYDALTTEQIAIATSKGWTVSRG